MKKTIIGILILGIFTGILLSLGTYKGVKETSGDKFCALCHSMQPMNEAYANDVHSGNNKVGIKTSCISCHLPQDSLVSYLYTKAKKGTKELAITIFTDTEDINWIEKRKNRKHFVYDSGCLNCHSKILEKTEAKNSKQIEMHKHYSNKLNTQTPLKCVSCHISVGHNGLRNKLNELKPEYIPVIEEGH